MGFRREDRVFGVSQSAGEIKREVQAATFLSLQSAVDDQFCDQRQVAKLKIVVGHPVLDVIVTNFLSNDADATAGSLQPLACAYDADKVPHEAAYFIPVMGYQNFIV